MSIRECDQDQHLVVGEGMNSGFSGNSVDSSAPSGWKQGCFRPRTSQWCNASSPSKPGRSTLWSPEPFGGMVKGPWKLKEEQPCLHTSTTVTSAEAT